jgi:hypothetical protein
MLFKFNKHNTKSQKIIKFIYSIIPEKIRIEKENDFNGLDETYFDTVVGVIKTSKNIILDNMFFAQFKQRTSSHRMRNIIPNMELSISPINHTPTNINKYNQNTQIHRILTPKKDTSFATSLKRLSKQSDKSSSDKSNSNKSNKSNNSNKSNKSKNMKKILSRLQNGPISDTIAQQLGLPSLAGQTLNMNFHNNEQNIEDPQQINTIGKFFGATDISLPVNSRYEKKLMEQFGGITQDNNIQSNNRKTKYRLCNSSGQFFGDY